MKFGHRWMVVVALVALVSGCGGGGGGGDGDTDLPPFELTEAREFRAIAGVSMGGYGALNLGTKHGALFGTIASLGGPVDMTRLLGTIERNVEVKAQTEIPREVGEDFTFDHLPPYPGRDSTISMIKDLTIAFGNPFLNHPDASRRYLASDSEPARIMRDDRLGEFTVVADPRGFLDGADQNDDGLRQVDEVPPTVATDVLLLAAGTLDRIAGSDVAGQLLGGREVVDLDGNGIFDVGDGIVVNFSEPFTDGNGDRVFQPELGETFTDAGLDGVAGTGDFGDGNGQFDYYPDRTTFIAEDPLTRIAGLSAEQIATQRLYMDVGEQDEFGFSRHYDNLVAVLRSKGLTVEVQDGFSSTNCVDVPNPDAQFLLVRYQGGHVGFGDVDGDDLINGDVCGAVTVWQRILSMLGFLDESFPDCVRGPGDFDGGGIDIDDPDIDLPGIRLDGELVHATIESPSLAPAGGAAPVRDVLVYEPPAFFNNEDDTFPVVYFLGGYGQDPGDFEQIQELMDILINTSQVQNMFLVFLPGAGGVKGSFYVNHVIDEAQVPEAPAVTSGRYEDSTINDLIPAIEREILFNRVKRPGD